jgi:hypothetical protein
MEKRTDKQFILYPGFWHAIIEGESKEDIEKVRLDALKWITHRL